MNKKGEDEVSCFQKKSHYPGKKIIYPLSYHAQEKHLQQINRISNEWTNSVNFLNNNKNFTEEKISKDIPFTIASKVKQIN